MFWYPRLIFGFGQLGISNEEEGCADGAKEA